MVRIALFVGAFLVGLAPSMGFAQTRTVVLELFTSQGCSSCPPADALLGELAKEPNLLALSLHVDYWDYLGWRDRFARPENTKRQKLYAQVARSRTIYTPQMIVQGADHLVGSQENDIRAAIKAHQLAPASAEISLKAEDSHVVVLVRRIGDMPEMNAKGILHFVTYDNPYKVKILRGENTNRTITYTNVVRDWLKLGYWQGEPEERFIAPVPSMGRGFAVILQDGKAGRILAAARMEP